jgi:DNA-binding IclR family transcriptional regulator
LAETDPTAKALRFIEDYIESVPHLEALILLWEDRDRPFQAADIAARIYVTPDAAVGILHDLQQRKLVRGDADGYVYDGRWDASGDFMELIVSTYRSNLIRVATLLHNKASRGIREFARAFERKEDR